MNDKGFINIVLVVVVIVAIIAIGGYFVLSKKSATYQDQKITPTGGYSQFELKALHGLWGGYNVSVKSNGEVFVQYQGPGIPLETSEGKISNDQIQKLVSVFAENNFVSMKNIKGQGVPDESIVEIIAIDSAGNSKVISQPYNDRTNEFKAIYDEFIKIGEEVRLNK